MRPNTAPSPHIFITEITQPNGTTKPVMSSQSLCDQSIHINRTWDGEIWNGNEVDPSSAIGFKKKYIHTKCTNSGALFLLMTLCSQGNIIYYSQSADLHGLLFLTHDLLKNILGFILPISNHEQLTSLGHYALSIRRPPSIFQAIQMDLFIIVDAAMRGQENMVLNIVNADPTLLFKKATIKNSVGVEYTVTTLQAAVMADDVQLIEKIKPYFENLTTDSSGNPINGLAEMHNQIKAIYIESLQCYCEIQTKKINQLISITKKTPDEETELQLAQARIKAYSAALENNNLNTLFETHKQAQEHNAFDFKPYVNAIISATDAELDTVMELISANTPEATQAAITRTGVAATQTDAARAKAFDELTLVEKLNHFREKFVEHMQSEIIFNPNHILSALQHNERIWGEVDANRIADPNYKKRSIIFSQLAGWAQRLASEPVKQDLRQGTYYLTETEEPRARQSRFNDIDRNDYPDISLLAPRRVDGLGFKFAAAVCGGLLWCTCGGGRGARVRGLRRVFQNLCQTKTTVLENLYTQHLRPRKSASV